MVDPIGRKSLALKELRAKCNKKGGSLAIKTEYMGQLGEDEVYVKCYVPGEGKVAGKITGIGDEAMKKIKQGLSDGKDATQVIKKL